jgi:hypothetical protein
MNVIKYAIVANLIVAIPDNIIRYLIYKTTEHSLGYRIFLFVLGSVIISINSGFVNGAIIMLVKRLLKMIKAEYIALSYYTLVYTVLHFYAFISRSDRFSLYYTLYYLLYSLFSGTIVFYLIRKYSDGSKPNQGF